MKILLLLIGIIGFIVAMSSAQLESSGSSGAKWLGLLGISILITCVVFLGIIN